MKYFFMIGVFISLFSCGGGTEIPLDDNGREDFGTFHVKFYEDSLFQLQRIEFPMMGVAPNGAEQFIWTTENWQYLKPVEADGREIDRQILDMDNVMQEKILIQGKFMIKLMYALIDNKWYLTSYSGIRDAAYFNRRPVEETTKQPIENIETIEEPTISIE